MHIEFRSIGSERYTQSDESLTIVTLNVPVLTDHRMEHLL